MDELLNAIEKMSVAELKEELVKRNADFEGQKPALRYKLCRIVMNENGAAGDDGKDDKESSSKQKRDEDFVDVRDGSDTEEMGYGNCRLPRQKESEISSRFITFQDAEESVDKFCGDGAISVKAWIAQLEEVNKIFQFSEEKMLVYAKKLLFGPAKQFIRIKRNVHTWTDFKREIVQEFHVEVSSRSIHQKLRERMLGQNEAWREYFYDMLSLGEQINLDTQSLIEYIVDGVDECYEKVILYGASNLAELKIKFMNFDEQERRDRTK